MKQMNIITKGVSVKYFMIAYFPIKVYIINFDNILILQKCNEILIKTHRAVQGLMLEN